MKVTDFALAQHIIKDLCIMEGIPFVDVAVDFDEDGGGIHILNTTHVCQTLYQIVSEYINNSEKIVGRQLLAEKDRQNDFLTNLATSLRGVQYSDNAFGSEPDELFLQSLYQRPLVWVLMKDLICPLADVELKNTRLVVGSVPQLDIAKFYETGEVDAGEYESYPFIFVNEIENKPVLNALLLIEAMKAHNIDPVHTLLDIFECELFDKMEGLLTLVFNNNPEGKKVFIHTLVNVLRIEGRQTKKTFAQAAQNTDRQNQFWYMGLIEGMLDKTRGADWSTTKELQPYVEAFWNKVENMKQQKKGQNVTFNELLQLKREEGPDGVDTSITLQQLLSSDRIW